MTEPCATEADPEIRPAARVVLIDARDRVLLFRMEGNFHDAGAIWIAPGGGLNPGETYEQAAVRELFEEVGIVAPLSNCVWDRRHVFPFQGRWYEARERYFVARVESAEVSTDGWEEHEHTLMTAHHWWSLEEIATSDEVFVPRALAALLPPLLAGRYPPTPLNVGT